MNTKNKKLLITIISLLILISIFGGYYLLNLNKDFNENNININSNLYKSEIEEFDKNYEINNDYIGKIRFDSGLIDLPFVKAKIENDAQIAYEKYLRMAWDTRVYDEEGSIFMDPYNDLNDQNLVIYGHYVYPEFDSSRTHKFTPLSILTDFTNYEKNKKIELILEKEIREYVISNVYYAKTDMNSDQPLEEGMEYMIGNFTEDALEYYMKRVNEEEFYDTGVEIGPDDKFLTLQTCVENRDDLKLIVIAKEIEVIKIR